MHVAAHLVFVVVVVVVGLCMRLNIVVVGKPSTPNCGRAGR